MSSPCPLPPAWGLRLSSPERGIEWVHGLLLLELCAFEFHFSVWYCLSPPKCWQIQINQWNPELIGYLLFCLIDFPKGIIKLSGTKRLCLMWCLHYYLMMLFVQWCFKKISPAGLIALFWHLTVWYGTVIWLICTLLEYESLFLITYHSLKQEETLWDCGLVTSFPYVMSNTLTVRLISLLPIYL